MKKLYKSTEDKKLSGVLGGLSDAMNIDSSLLRVIFIILLLITGIFPIVFIYIAAAIFMPEDKEIW